MPEHFHLICQSESIITIIQSIKSYTAKKIIEFYEGSNNQRILNQFFMNKKRYKDTSKYQVWQEGFKPKAILSDNMFWQKINYIHNNPVKRGLANEIDEYEYSSAKDYFSGKPGKIIIDEFDYT
jgi:putative transposase